MACALFVAACNSVDPPPPPARLSPAELPPGASFADPGAVRSGGTGGQDTSGSPVTPVPPITTDGGNVPGTGSGRVPLLDSGNVPLLDSGNVGVLDSGGVRLLDSGNVGVLDSAGVRLPESGNVDLSGPNVLP